MPLLDYELIRANPKVLMGYSDITALLCAIHQRTGLVTFHGPIAGDNFTEYSYEQFRRTLMNKRSGQLLAPPPPFDDPGPGRVEKDNRLSLFRGGVAEGPLLGGNLSLLCHLMGTPYQPDFAGRILFLEDVNEAYYRLDRMLTHLLLAGKLDQVSGIALGKFTKIPEEGNSFNLEEIIEQLLVPLGIPVVRGLLIGHVADKTTVPIGIQAELDGDKGTLTLLEAAVT